jgi:hypothetical protein
MAQKKPNYFARVLAVLALVGAGVLVVATIATSGGGGDDDGGDTEKTAEGSGPTRQGERALEEGVWVVEDGDTLVSISEATGIDLDELVELNSDIDPQALIAGQRISLRAGEVSGGGDDESSTTDTNEDPADEFGDGSVGDDNSGASDGVSSP